jgi:hypothetical protein
MLSNLPTKILWLKSPMPLRFDGDIGLIASYDHELSKGLKGGLSNYVIVYYINIFFVHHLLKFELDEDHPSNEMATNEHFNVEEGTKGNGPFKALIEMGLMKTTTNNVKVCGALKDTLDAQV